MDYVTCPVCKMPAREIRQDVTGDDREFDCRRCGEFKTAQDAAYWLRETLFQPQQIAAISYHIRRNAGLTIGRDSLPTLRTLAMPSVPEKIARFLAQLSKRHPLPGDVLDNPLWAILRLEGTVRNASVTSMYPDGLCQEDGLEALSYLGDAGIVDGVEFRWLIINCMMPQGLLTEGGVSGHLQISPLGWQEVARLQEINASSRIGFVAMSFHPDFLPLFDLAVAPGITAAGYEAVRVDRREHNNRIDDEIIALIKRSRFVVADFSRNRGGIYFEAGLAIGLGLPVIWTVRQDRSERVHFDTRQFNHIRWEPDKLPEFVKALQNRIEATIGRGPLSTSP